MWGLRSSRTVAIGAAAAVFVVVSLLPVVYMLALALASPRAWTATILDARQRGLLLNTTALGVGSAVFASVIGAPLGFILARVPLPFKSGLRLILLAPLLLPPYVIALAWIYLEGTLREVLPTAAVAALPDPYTRGGAIVALTVVFYPLAMIATEVGLRRVEARLEEAAVLVARPSRVLWRITWPLVAPSVVSAALVIFVLAISEFSVPGLLRVRVFTTEIFTAFAALYEFGQATVLAVPLLIVSCVVAAAAAFLLRDRVLVTRRGLYGSPLVPSQAWTRMAAVFTGAAIFLTLALPVAAIAREAFRADSMAAVIEGSRAAVVNSLAAATIGATAITATAVCLGYARARTLAAGAAAVDVLWIVLFTVPSTVVGIGLIGVWNRPSPWGWFYGTGAMLVIGYLARFLPVAALAAAAAIRSVPASQEEAAAVSGSRWLRTMAQIVVPQIRLGLLAVWVITLILAFGEVGTSILVAPPGESTLPIRVYTMTANAAPGQIATLALFQSLVILGPLVVIAIVLSTRSVR
jgi:iron(III) transport system permease protein